jgi:hypothetical protein
MSRPAGNELEVEDRDAREIKTTRDLEKSETGGGGDKNGKDIFFLDFFYFPFFNNENCRYFGMRIFSDN